jgi:hypothetical protein
MRKTLATLALITAVLSLTVSCKQLFTFSLAQPLERDEVKISAKLDLDELLNLKATDYGKTIEGSTAITNAIAKKNPGDITALSATDQQSILTTAIGAVAGIDVMLALDTALPTATMVEEFLEAFDSSVDLTAVQAILDAYTLTSEISQTTVILAAAVLLADAVAATDAATVMAILDGTNATNTIGDPILTSQLDTVKNIAFILSGSAELAGFDILALINGGI